jgi:cytochrome P450
MAAMQPTAQIESPAPLGIHRALRPPGKRYPTPFHFFLAWAALLLAQHPEVGDQLRAEVSSELAGRAPGLADLPRLELTRRVIDETLRFYPPVAVISRETFAADKIDGFVIPAKSGVMLSPYITDRHRAFWPDPERFDPERFTPEEVAARPRFAYFPFSGGPRLCIGNEFAMMEAHIWQ